MSALRPIESAMLARMPQILHGFFTREGGVSKGIFASLNCGLGSADDPRAVIENRTRAMMALGLSLESLLTVWQCHSARVTTVTRPWLPAAAPECDAMVTKARGLALGVLVADCAPVLFADPEAGVIGAAHAGWRGALSGVLEATLAGMEDLGAARARIAAAIGPCIGRDAYEVGPEFVRRFCEEDPRNARFFSPAERAQRSHFDLGDYAASRLEAARVAKIDRLNICTYADPRRFFSYRRATHRGEEDYGRNLSVIALKP